jgi:hypothetical protein
MQKQTMESGVKEKAARWRASGVGYERPYFAFLLNTPALLIVVLLAGYPIVYSAWISLHKFSLKRPRVFDFVGLANYRRILESEEFWSALWVDSKSAVRRTTHLIMKLSRPLVAIDRTSDRHQPLSQGSSLLATTSSREIGSRYFCPLLELPLGLLASWWPTTQPAAAPSLPWPAMWPATPPTTAPLMQPLASTGEIEVSASRHTDAKIAFIHVLRD